MLVDHNAPSKELNFKDPDHSKLTGNKLRVVGLKTLTTKSALSRWSIERFQLASLIVTSAALRSSAIRVPPALAE